jgi:hypothetical protein
VVVVGGGRERHLIIKAGKEIPKLRGGGVMGVKFRSELYWLHWGGRRWVVYNCWRPHRFNHVCAHVPAVMKFRKGGVQDASGRFS